MPKVTGRLTDVSADPMRDAEPTLIFEYTSAAVAGSSVLAPRPVVVAPAWNGYFEVNLTDSAKILPGGHYTLTIEWRDARTRQLHRSRMPWELHVPAAGGTLAELLRLPANAANVWTGTTPPKNPVRGLWWLNPETGDLKEWTN